MTKYIIGEIFSSSGATLYKNPSDQTVISIHGKTSSEIPQITITNTDSKVTKAIAHEEEPLNEKLEAISTSGSTYKKPFKTSAGNRNFATLLKSNDKHSSDTKTDDVESKNGSKLDSTIGKKEAQNI